MRLGIYGGAFSPPHKGHTAAAKYFLSAAKLDKLLIMPSLISPHKPTSKDDDPQKRIKMLQLSFEDEPKIKISDYEIQKGGVSYTYLTLKHFKENGDTICFLVGSDMFLSLDSWREPAEIFANAEIWCLTRTGTDTAELNAKKREYKEKFGAECYVCENEAVVVSSTDVRRLLRQGKDSSEYLPDSVYRYIKENDLYGVKNAEIKEYIYNNLSKDRYEHSTGVADTAEELADALGLPDADKAKLIRAGLCHDISKELSIEEQFDLVKEAGIEPVPDYYTVPVTLHQLSGAVLAEKLFHIDKDVFNMIQYHCTGSPGMNLCEKILFLADFIEPKREYEACRTLRAEMFSDKITEERINKIFVKCCERQLKHLQEKGRPAHSLTRLTYDTEVNKMAEEKKLDLTNANSKDTAEEAKRILDEKLAKNIEIIPVRDKTVVTDFFVIANATSTTHVKALADEVEYKLGEAGLKPLHTDGVPGGEWFVLDYGAVIIHIFTGNAREFYKLDRLWQDKAPSDSIGEEEK